MKHLVRLLEISSPSISSPRESVGRGFEESRGQIFHELGRLLSHRNGFLAFEGALHVLPLGEFTEPMGVAEWNSPALWRDSYGELAMNAFFFAEDVFGNQFCVRDGKIHTFDAETGETEVIADTLDGWAAAILEDFDRLTGFPVGHDWQVEHRPLNVGERLVPLKPFVIGGEYLLQNLRAVPAVRGMRWRGKLARQIRDLPDGSSFTLDALG